MKQTISSRLEALGFTLPANVPPAANYVPSVRVGNQLYISGQISIEAGGHIIKGLLGQDIGLEEGRRAAQASALNVLAQIAAATSDDFTSVRRLVRIGVFIASSTGFQQQSLVADGASDLFVGALGEAGHHVRAAVGVAALPRAAAVEIDAIVELVD